MLQQADAYAQNIAYQHALEHYEYSQPTESLSHQRVSCAEGFQQPYYGSTLKYYDEQSANHREPSHTHHQYEYNPHIEVEQIKPREYLRIDVPHGQGTQGSSLAVQRFVHIVNYAIFHHIYAVKIIHQQLATRHLHVSLLSIRITEAAYRVEVGEAEGLIIFRKVGLVYASNLEHSCSYVVLAKEVGIDFIASL